MLIIPMWLGLAAGGVRSGAAWLVPPAAVLVFLAHHAIVPWAQRLLEKKASPPGYAARRLVWGAAYLASAVLVFAGAVLAAAPEARGPFLTIAAIASVLAGIYAVACVLGRGRSIGPETLGLAGVSLSAPMMAAAAGRPLDRGLLGASALALGYFLSSVSYVRAYEALRVNRQLAIRSCVAAHVALAAALSALAAYGTLPRWWWAVFIPVIVRTVWGLAIPPGNVRQVGLREAWVAATFSLLACLALR